MRAKKRDGRVALKMVEKSHMKIYNFIGFGYVKFNQCYLTLGIVLRKL